MRIYANPISDGGGRRDAGAPGLGFNLLADVCADLEACKRAAPEPQYRLLVVEDEPNDAELMREAIKELGRVDVAGSSDEALAMVHASIPFGVALIDLVLRSGRSGAYVAQRIKQQSPDTRIVLVSGHINEQLEELARANGFLVLQKPVSKAQLIESLKTKSA